MKNFLSRPVHGLLLIAAALGTTSAARAADTDSAGAQALFDQAKKLMAAGKYAEACPKLEESERLDPALGTLLNLADCHEKQGRKASAWSEFLEAAAKAQSGGHAAAEKAARDRANALSAKLPKIVIQVAGASTPGLQVSRDNIVVGSPTWGTPIPIDSGSHTVSASAPSHRSFSTTVTVPDSATIITVTVSQLEEERAPEAAPVPATPTRDVFVASSNELGSQRTVALASGGIGLAAVVAGSVFGFRSKGKHDDAEPHCDPAGCDQEGVDLRNDARSAGNISTALFIVGAAGLGAGAVLWFTAKPTSSTTTAQLSLGLGTVAVRGTW